MSSYGGSYDAAYGYGAYDQSAGAYQYRDYSYAYGSGQAYSGQNLPTGQKAKSSKAKKNPQ